MTHVPDIAGKYKIIAHANTQDDILKERITIGPDTIGDRCFSIGSIDGPTGEWAGSFIMDKDYVLGEGEYRYTKKNHFGKHKFKIDPSSSQIKIYGESIKPKLKNTFWLILEREQSK